MPRRIDWRISEDDDSTLSEATTVSTDADAVKRECRELPDGFVAINDQGTVVT
jgi:hypothetical protein